MTAATPIAAEYADETARTWRPQSTKLVVGAAILVFFVLLALVGPFFVGADPLATSAATLQGPSGAHPLGTTQTGQDVLAQLLDGGRISLLVGFLAGALATVFSILVGLVSGYLGGIVDLLLSVLTNVFLVIPGLPLLIVLAGYLPSRGIWSIAIVIAVTGWAWGARVLRAQTLSLRRRDFVESARASGESTWRIIFVEIFPNEMQLIVASFLFTVIFAILADAGLAFLGLGNLSVVSWGTMLYYAQNSQALLAGAWWWFVPPGLCIACLGAGLALMNFGIDELANPRLRATNTRALRRMERRYGS